MKESKWILAKKYRDQTRCFKNVVNEIDKLKVHELK